MSIECSTTENDPEAKKDHQKGANSPFSAKGRFSRYSFLAWSFLLYLPFIVVVTFLIISATGMERDFINLTSGFAQSYAAIEFYFGEKGVEIIIPILFFVALLVFFILNTLFFIRRLHDINLSGWFSLLIWLPVPIAISVIYFYGLSDVAFIVFFRMALFISFSFFIFISVKKGTEGFNKFGFVRATPIWEKSVAILALLFTVGYIVFTFSIR
jgi:uncharacterized membrane protein YhaH (DUF805 family)